MRVAVHQPNYAPWCGYFAKMLVSDVFVFFDDVQLPQGRSYVSRAKVAKGKDGEQWLTVPVSKSGTPAINEVRLADPGFAAKHLSTLRHGYARTPYLSEVLDLVAPVYDRAGESLAELNMDLIRTVAGYLGWQGTFALSSERPSDLKADERIADLVSAAGGTTYVSGAGGQNYQTEQTYAERGVSLEVRTYQPVEYERSGWPWVPGLSVLDALFHLGRDAREVLRYPHDEG
jgi:hypothetical protein